MRYIRLLSILLLILLVTVGCESEIMSEFLVDSYADSNANTSTGLGAYFNDVVGQSFTGKAGNLTACKFYLIKSGSPTGNAVAKLYIHSGTYGTTSLPTGEALATSDNVDVSTIGAIEALITFDFTGEEQYTLIEGTKYCIVVEYYGGDISNSIGVLLDSTSPTHTGNYLKYYDDAWSYNAAVDTIFYVYAEEPEPEPIPEPDPETPIETPDIISALKPISLKRTREINGAWYINMICQADENIHPEGYLIIDGEEYLIKKYEQTKEGSILYNVEAYSNFIELGNPGSTIDRFYRTDTVENLLDYILDGSYWVAGDCDISQTLIFKIDKRVSRLEALNLLAEKAGGELYWHSDTRTVDLKRQIGTVTNLHLRVDKNAQYIKRDVDSSNLITRLFCYGPDNYPINSTTIDDCDDETSYTGSGSLTLSASEELKMNGSKAIVISATALNETATRDLTAGNVIDLSDHDSVKFWIYSETANAAGFTFGIGESAYTEQAVNTGALEAGCWHEIELDLSEVANGSKNAIRYIGFKNLTDGAAEVIFDNIRGFYGNTYIDSDNINLYKYVKEAVYTHNARAEKTVYETVIYPSADSYVSQSSPYNNYGNSAVIKIKEHTSDFIGYIKFLLSSIPSGATITSAKLNINIASTDFTSGGTVDVELAVANWNESTLTYTNRPAAGDKQTDFEANSTGAKEVDITTTVQGWYSGAIDNYGLKLDLNISSVDKTVNISSKESADKPYLLIEYTLESDPSPVIEAAAKEYLAKYDEPKISYKAKIVDLSKVMADTWQDETIGLGDTLRVYDVDLNLNTEVRVVKITENLLDPADVNIELGNKAYTIIDSDVENIKKLSYAMPFNNDPRILDANAIQAGYSGAK